MKSRTSWLVVSTMTLVALSACQGGSSADPSPTTTASAAPTTTKAPDVKEFESGPESPIAYGLSVPEGATQLGPLFRFRSQPLIEAYQPELATARAQSKAEAEERVTENEQNGTPAPPVTPAPTTRPSSDSFDLIDDAPRPDTTISLMRIDGPPSDVVRRMLAEIDAALPDAGLVLDDLSKYCTAEERRIVGCHVEAQGKTNDDREIAITMDVDPGKLATRTSPPANMTKPAMQLTIAYVGDPRAGQLSRDTGKLDNVADIKTDDETSGLIWPKMDEDAPRTTKLVNGWVAPASATLLLSAFRSPFVTMTTPSAAQGDKIAEDFVFASSRNGGRDKDVVEDLNSVSTVYSATTKDGGTVRAIHNLSARGNFTALFYSPKPADKEEKDKGDKQK